MEGLKCKDYAVSQETFQLVYDKNYEMLITTPKPPIHKLGSYYESKEYISHTDSKKSLIDKVYQLVKSYTIAKKIRLVNGVVGGVLSEKRMLDIGCGTGDFLTACKKNNWEVEGVEPNPKAKKLTEEKLQQKIHSDISEIKNKQFDCITMWHVLEHVPNLDEYISALYKLLKPEGKLIIAVPNYKSYDANYYGKFWAAYDVPRHLWHFSKKSILKLFAEKSFQLIEIVPMYFDSFYVSLLSEKYKTGKSNFFKAFYIGLISNLKANKTKQYSSLIYILNKSK